LENVAGKANAIDSLRTQVDLMKHRLKRLEDAGGINASTHRTEILSLSHREPLVLEQTPAPPSVQTASSVIGHSLVHPEGNMTTYPPPHVTRTESGYRPSPSSQTPSGHPQLEPQLSISSWRPAASYSAMTSPAPPPVALSQTLEPDPQPQPTSGWTSVNSNIKRAHRTAYDATTSSSPGSPKRPKLAPLIPRSSYGDEVPLASTPSTYHHSTTAATSQSSLQSHGASRNPSNESQAYPHQPGSSYVSKPSQPYAPPLSSKVEAELQEPWRPESQWPTHLTNSAPTMRASPKRGRGGRGGRGRKSNPELGTPEWEKSEWNVSQGSPSGFYPPHVSPQPAHERDKVLLRRSSGHIGGLSDRRHSIESEPMPHSPMTPEMTFLSEHSPNAQGKKTRTKPFRNEQGVLIRKDGRPDMRSVSSAMNLRKVHAKKEAERAAEEGKLHTPTSALAIAPALSASDESRNSPATPPVALDGDDERDRHKVIMSKIFPYGIDGGAKGRSYGEQFFPRPEEAQPPEVKIEADGERDGDTAMKENDDDRPMTAWEHAEEEARKREAAEKGKAASAVAAA
ncbi:hypothetical protein LTR66_007299, partial [Elasticomyces elasticus]